MGNHRPFFRCFIALAVLSCLTVVFPVHAQSAISNDEFSSDQWYLRQIHAPEAWGKVQQNADIIVAVIDSGVDIDHPDLKNNIWTNSGEISGDGIDNDHDGYIDDIYGWDFIENNNDPRPKLSGEDTGSGPDSLTGINHGTILAGIIAAETNNGIGIAGIAPKTRIMALRALDASGTGDTQIVAQAINYAVDHKADIINLSFVGPGRSEKLERAIQRAYDAGVIIVAAAGNAKRASGSGAIQPVDLDATPLYPVCQDGNAGENRILGVAASDPLDQRALFSNFGFNCIDLFAPGVGIKSTIWQRISVNGQQLYADGWSGTSMAAAVVSGVAALVKATNPHLTGREVQQILLEHSQDISSMNASIATHGTFPGRVDALMATQAAQALMRTATPINVVEEGNIALLFSDAQDHSVVELSTIEGTTRLTFPVKGGGLSSTIAATSKTNDHRAILAIGSGKGRAPTVSLYTSDGLFLRSFPVFTPSLKTGIAVAFADIDGDGNAEVIVGPQEGGGPLVQVYSQDGRLMGQFFAFDKKDRGGLYLAGGDLNGDGIDEIITGAGKGSSPQVRVYSGNGVRRSLIVAFQSSYRGGVAVASADLDGDGTDELIVAAASNGTAHVRVLNQDGALYTQWFTAPLAYRQGIRITAGDLTRDGRAEVVSLPVHPLYREVRVYGYDGFVTSWQLPRRDLQQSIAAAYIRRAQLFR